MAIDWTKIKNPIFDREPAYSPRDPAVIYHDGIFRCYHSAVSFTNNRFSLALHVAESRDLNTWSRFRCINASDLCFSSPGNIIRVNDKWVMCVQSYPIKEGQLFGGEESRLWLMESGDLENWSEPRIMKAEGCQANWTKSHRQVDPYIIQHNDKFWCLYKTSGKLGLMVSEDLTDWHEASPDKPILSEKDTPDGATVENPCVVKVDDGFVLFFSPCREGRGIGIAKSQNLIDWTEIRYLDFPKLAWAEHGPTAAMVTDARKECGKWLMFFHGDRPHHFGAAMGIAWSDNLETWVLPDEKGSQCCFG